MSSHETLGAVNGTAVITSTSTSGSTVLLKLIELYVHGQDSIIKVSNHIIVLLLVRVPWKELVMVVVVVRIVMVTAVTVTVTSTCVMQVVVSSRDSRITTTTSHESVTGGGGDCQVLVPGELGFGAIKVHLELAELVLEERDDPDAAVDGVTEPHLGLIGEGIDGVFTLVRVQVVEELGDVASAEDSVDVGELLRLIGWEVRCKCTLGLAFAAQKLACCTW